MKTRFRLALTICLPLLLAAPVQAASSAPKPEPVKTDPVKLVPNLVAVLTLVGDTAQLASVGGPRGDQAQLTEWTATPTGQLDAAALRAVDQRVRAEGSKRETKLFTSTTRSLFGDPAGLFVGGKLNLPGKLGDAVRQSGAPRLLLITRSQQDAGLAPALPARVSATLDGAGFVLDQRPADQIGFDGRPGLPTLSAYAFLRVALIDVTDMHLVREQSIAVARRLSVPRESAASPWNLLTAEQRVEPLIALIEAELPKAVGAVIGD
jgi:hypothetical protein